MTSRKSSFISPDMFDEFILPAYEKIYGYWKANGVQLIIHHSDSYGANLVPSMIRMGIDIWQGCMYGNNIPELVKKYGGKSSFQGGELIMERWIRRIGKKKKWKQKCAR